MIVVYTPHVRYEIKDDQVYEVTASGRRRVTLEYAKRCVRQWREREAKTITVAPPTARQIALLVTGWAVIAVTLVGALWWFVG